MHGSKYGSRELHACRPGLCHRERSHLVGVETDKDERGLGVRLEGEVAGRRGSCHDAALGCGRGGSVCRQGHASLRHEEKPVASACLRAVANPGIGRGARGHLQGKQRIEADDREVRESGSGVPHRMQPECRKDGLELRRPLASPGELECSVAREFVRAHRHGLVPTVPGHGSASGGAVCRPSRICAGERWKWRWNARRMTSAEPKPLEAATSVTESSGLSVSRVSA